MVPRAAFVSLFAVTALAGLVLAPAASAAYPGANGNVLFDNSDPADPALPGPDIYSFNGGAAHNLTPSDHFSWGSRNPVASGDGRRIVFESNRSGETQIYSINADGSDLTQLTADPEGAFDPTISPDGSHVAFIHGGPGAQLSIMRSDGSNVRQLMPIAPGGSTPAIGEPIFDNTGASLVFFGSVTMELPGCYCHNEHFELDAINSDGSELRHLADLERFYSIGRKPTLSPDGGTIAFSGLRPEDSSSEIYTMKLDGSDVTRLTNNSAEDVSPAFSPDGREILFQTDRGGSKDIYVMQRDGSDQRPMYASSGTEENPEWAPSTLTCDHKQVTVLGTPGNDKLVGTSRDDVIIGGGGSDRITGGAGNDTICSGKGDDTITAGSGNDRLWGVAGADTLQGRSGGDFLNGGPGRDVCNGAGGTDRGKLCERRHSIP